MRTFASALVTILVLTACMDGSDDPPAEVADEIVAHDPDPAVSAFPRFPRPGEVYSVCGYTLCMEGWVDLRVVSDPACGSGIRTYCHPCGGGYPQPQCR